MIFERRADASFVMVNRPSQKQFAKALGVSVPYPTVTLDRLERAGFCRSRSEVDRRSALVRLTRTRRGLAQKAEALPPEWKNEFSRI